MATASPNVVMDTMPAPASADSCPARVDLVPEFGWRRVETNATSVWIFGHFYGSGEKSLLELAAKADWAGLVALLPALDGHFGLVVDAGAFVLAATDPVASTPLFIAATGDAGRPYAIDARARRLAARCRLATFDRAAVLDVAMSGFTIGDSTLLQGLISMRPGEYALFRAGRVERKRYHIYRPWRVRERSRETMRRELGGVLRALFEKVAGALADRPIVVPLSAGLDSRLVASGLKEVGHRDVRCFAYGRPGNFEADASRRIAERLGFPWTFIPTTPATQRAYFSSEAADSFMAFADTCAGIPFHQDYDAVSRLAQTGFLPRDAVLINGQSGDYITGNHIPDVLCQPAPGGAADVEVRWARTLDAAVAKHFALWRHLMTPENVASVKRRLRVELERCGATGAEPDYALYEQSEFDHRQARYVVQGQRSYDHLGFDWRLPLWDRALIDFFEAVPLEAKRKQRLYRGTIESLDWGGVWRGQVYPRWVTPSWLRPVRWAARAAAAPFGAERWHAWERRGFVWHMDTICSYACVPYAKAVRDSRGFRNAFSWHVEAYLAARGIALDELATGRPA